jgi:hypothetical protein
MPRKNTKKTASSAVAHNPNIHPEVLASNVGTLKGRAPGKHIQEIPLTATNGLALLAINTRNKNLNLPHAAKLGLSMRDAAQGIEARHGLERQPYMSGVTMLCLAVDDAGLPYVTDGQHNSAASVLAGGTKADWMLLARFLGYTKTVKVTEENIEDYPDNSPGDTITVTDYDKFQKTVGYHPLPDKTAFDKKSPEVIKELGRDHYTTHAPTVIVNSNAHPLSFLVKNGSATLKATAGSFLQRDGVIAAELAREGLDSELAASVVRLVRLRTSPGINYKGTAPVDPDGNPIPRFGATNKGGAAGSADKVRADWEKFGKAVIAAWRLVKAQAYDKDSLAGRIGNQYIVTALALGILGSKVTPDADEPGYQWDQTTVAGGLKALGKLAAKAGTIKPTDEPLLSDHLLIELNRKVQKHVEKTIVDDETGEESQVIEVAEALAPKRMKGSELLGATIEVIASGDDTCYDRDSFYRWFVHAAIESGETYNPEQEPTARWVGPDSNNSIKFRSAKK